jgi:DNA-binding HxlR family transcriptional regulator
MIDLESSAARSAAYPRGDCFNNDCPGRAVLSHIEGRWSTLILAALRRDETLRFSQLRDRIGGVSERMLSKTLRELERDGLISRHSLGTVPPHVEYRLTPMGVGVSDHVSSLISWIETHVHDLVDAQREHDRATA